MGEATQPKTQDRTVAELVQAAELDEEARKLLTPTIAPRGLVQAMLERDLHADAVRFLAHALPRREAVWWAWVCARRAAGDAPPPQIRAALDATERWIREPSDEHRRAAMQRAEAADFGTAAGCAALAAFLSGDNLAPPNVEQRVPPGEFMAAKAIAGAIVLAAVAQEPEKAPEKFQAFIQQGLDVVNRIKLWPEGS
jgi:hypothetical protein